MAALRYSRISDRLLAGPMPFGLTHVDQLLAEGVGTVVNLCEEREYWRGERDEVLNAYRAAGIVEHHLPVKDGSTVPVDVIAAAVAAAGDTTVYVHCRGGRERSATVATALLAAAEGLEIEHALARARERRPIFAPLPWQVTALHAWASGA
jgi:atypical dual specificity phosphatase